MRLILLTALTMVAFAMNSVLNRAAVDAGHATAEGFAVIRVLSGVLVLALLVTLRRGQWELRNPRRWGGAVALAAYMIGFSLAYVSLDTGTGALILFGSTQIALFAHTALTGAPPTARQILGAAVAFLGLVVALWPDEASGGLSGAFLMIVAGLGWAGYTVAGRGADDPLAATATHFLLCLPLVAVLLLMNSADMNALGWLLAILSGAVTSGLGYALWYHVLPGLPGARAAVVLLSVPVIAIILGIVFLGEAVAPQLWIAALLVVGGIGLALSRPVSARPAPADRR